MGKWYIEKIIIDSRERTRGENAFKKYHDLKYNLQVKPLDYGDYLFKTTNDEKIIFEYKTLEDFIKSMEDKSLFQEISNQTSTYPYSYLILEYDYEKAIRNIYYKVPKLRYKYKTLKKMESTYKNQIDGALERIYSIYAPVIFVESEDEAFDKMLNISSKVGDVKKYGGSVRPSKKNITNNHSELYLTNIKGVGGKKANMICNELGIKSLEDLVNCEKEDFLKCSRISEKLVDRIWESVHGL